MAAIPALAVTGDEMHKRVSKIVTSKDEWRTPQWLFDLLDQEFHFQIDAAANPENAKCPAYFEDLDAVSTFSFDWHLKGAWERFFLNPPYSAGNIDRFLQKAYEESLKGAIVVCLVPCATDTKWWHNYAMKSQEIRFIKGRVRFVGYDENGNQVKNSPTFSSCVVIFDQKLWQGNPYPWIGKTIEQPIGGKS
jgi:site-specific DNA-methyltransferase (adenine-specific)